MCILVNKCTRFSCNQEQIFQKIEQACVHFSGFCYNVSTPILSICMTYFPIILLFNLQMIYKHVSCKQHKKGAFIESLMYQGLSNHLDTSFAYVSWRFFSFILPYLITIALTSIFLLFHLSFLLTFKKFSILLLVTLDINAL